MNVGVAAHITAASPGGPRYDASLTQDERRSISNGIWVCQTCGKLVDNDETRYATPLLIRWKQDAEQEALRAVESTAQASNWYFENTEVSGGNGSVGNGGNASIKGTKSGNVEFIGGSIKGGDGGEGGGKGGDATVEGGSG